MTEPVAAKRQTETRLAVEKIAEFAVKAQGAALTSEIRQLYHPNILERLGCASADLRGASFQALREQFKR
jgi:hypothetical protein